MDPAATGIPVEPRQELIRRLLASRQFAQAESLRRILLFLFERSLDALPTPVREQEIATRVLNRPADFDPKIDPIVRVSIASIRDRLNDYFEHGSDSEPVLVSIPKGQYRLLFEPRPPQDLRGPDARTRFWRPYLSPGNPNLLVYTELLFFRDATGNFHRNIYINDRTTPPLEVTSTLGLAEGTALSPSYHFVSAGEMSCLLAIQNLFVELGSSIDPRNSRFFSWSDARRANLVLLGGARTNPFARALLGGLPIHITPHSIQESGGPGCWTGQRFQDGDLERCVEFALITRRAGPVAGTTVTLVGANHGRAIEGAGRFLTDESHLLGVEEAFGQAGLPDQFQVLVRVEMLDYDEEVVDVSYVTHRLISAPIASSEAR